MIELEKAYDASKVEDEIYQRWMDSGYFNPDNLERKGEPYTIIMPPPNANGAMHVGHALFVTMEDILIRYHRMQGRRALWLPGTDHAGFETQVVYEKKLDKEGRSRFQMTRDEFYKEVMEFVLANKHVTEKSLQRLGASCDWDRNIFTLDPEIIKVVYETFKQMYNDGLVYRAGRICNWCSKHQTGLADLETKYEERQDTFYYFKYGPFTIGTARPETKFGDKYVVMHPDDVRYQDYKHGDKVELEWINGPITATVIKDSAIDMEFGTGVMTITPAHDPVDFEIAQRHNLDIEQVIDKRGKLLPIAGEFAGLKIAEARPKIVEKLQAKGLLDEAKTDANYKHNVQVCYKCSTVIEPQIVDQWYIAMTKPLADGKSLRDMAIEALDNKAITMITERFEKIFRHWMENLRDWPISRQIWWGIPIPVKYCQDCKEAVLDLDDTITSCPKCHGSGLEQDPDTFDTWFSSGQWPFATMLANDTKRGTQDISTYFPTDVMETGWDILFFWVARMVMLSYYRIKKPPFKSIYLHGLVRDKDRQKMSKSKGNVIDPLAVIDTYGTDALRFALVFSTAAGNDIPLAEDKIKGMKHFGNKLWNIARYILANAEGVGSRVEGIDTAVATTTPYPLPPKPLTDADKDILQKLDETIKAVTAGIDSFNIHEGAQAVYAFAWHELADVYLEASKEQLKDEKLKANTEAILMYCLEITLRLLHPFMPFVTEEIWSYLYPSKTDKTKMLMIAEWPK